MRKRLFEKAKSKNVYQCVRLDENCKQKIKAVAKRFATTESGVIRLAIEEFLKKHGAAA